MLGAAYVELHAVEAAARCAAYYATYTREFRRATLPALPQNPEANWPGTDDGQREPNRIKFKLVEDIRLVTIPITSCLCVLLSYLVFGAILFRLPSQIL